MPDAGLDVFCCYSPAFWVDYPDAHCKMDSNIIGAHKAVKTRTETYQRMFRTLALVPHTPNGDLHIGKFVLGRDVAVSTSRLS